MIYSIYFFLKYVFDVLVKALNDLLFQKNMQNNPNFQPTIPPPNKQQQHQGQQQQFQGQQQQQFQGQQQYQQQQHGQQQQFQQGQQQQYQQPR